MTNLIDLLGIRVVLALSVRSLSDLEREEGQTLAEYALVISLVAVVLIAVISTLAGSLRGMFRRTSSAI
ncbi:MAG TPA: hypothetical protein VH063_01240 [Gaiellaceae bacterium]|jgi:Flp pilus assembly pilin Flp|nr:hypothetical protein [Gaiellaceae bacterium]